MVGSAGRLPKWPTGADCKSAGLRLRWFESITYHHFEGGQSRGNSHSSLGSASFQSISNSLNAFSFVASLARHSNRLKVCWRLVTKKRLRDAFRAKNWYRKAQQTTGLRLTEQRAFATHQNGVFANSDHLWRSRKVVGPDSRLRGFFRKICNHLHWQCYLTAITRHRDVHNLADFPFQFVIFCSIGILQKINAIKRQNAVANS